ncbi:MAG: hypothetical protein D6730_19165, partial [Bacteroidetes bacterium]
MYVSYRYVCLLALLPAAFACQSPPATSSDTDQQQLVPKVEYTLTGEQTHNKFSKNIPPVLRVPSGAVIEALTQDASHGQFDMNSTAADLDSFDFSPVHPLTGPVYVEGAMPGDVLKVTLHKIELGDYGWNAILPGFGFLADTLDFKYLKMYELGADKEWVAFNDKIRIPLKPFAGVMGVAPDTEELLSTIPPRANGGNMDDPNLTEGTTVYFPVFVEGALFSIGDAHAAQGLGEVCGTAIEAPMRFVYQLEVVKGRSIAEPQYETADYYATTGFGTTIDEAAKKAVLYMLQYLEEQHGLSTEEAYALCSLAGDLKIAEV